ncbi:hypothetical protein [Jiella avicenniae]|uniref:Uncharacterized protein n=1 Tax=Jiella avicenniae TaxID=2907202 RepID=A0A9X1T7X1_9HYPH|nr:hypothetical protein [Jiella avicenniae]MCE7030925.1 hypothetical protein [Jiella avicenniae]
MTMNTIDRRTILALIASCFLTRYASAQSIIDTVDPIATSVSFGDDLKKLLADEALVDGMKKYREAEFFPSGSGFETAPISISPSSLAVSQRAVELIIASEVSGREQYERRYQSPIWPEAQSGITFGIGYDIGYASKKRFYDDWKLYMGDDTIDVLYSACGITGQSAKELMKLHKAEYSQVIIPWYIAHTQFLDRVLPRYVGWAEKSLPNFSELSEDSRGALVSLVYNRGASFNIPENRDPRGRYREMRKIRSLMSLRNYADIPAQITKMKRLWDYNKLPGLHIRRDAEAKLFTLGLL